MNDASHSSHPSDDWQGRFATDSDAQDILDLLLATFGTWPLQEITVPAIDHVRWKLLTHDDIRAQQIVIDDGDRIVGLNGIFRQRMKVRDRIRRTHQVLDLAVLPEYQNRGIISATRRFAVSDRIPDCDVLFGPQGRAESREAIRRTGKWDPAVRKSAFLRALVLEGPVSPPLVEHQSPWSVKTPTRFDDRVHAFSEEATQPFDLISAHDVEFLNWRYCDPRAGRWTVHTAEEGGRILGYVTYRISNGTAYVGGLLALPDRLDVVKGLLQEMMRSLDAHGVPTVQCWTTAYHPYRAVFQDLGMEKKRRHLRFTMHAEGEDFSSLEDPAAPVHIVAGDTDLV